MLDDFEPLAAMMFCQLTSSYLDPQKPLCWSRWKQPFRLETSYFCHRPRPSPCHALI